MLTQDTPNLATVRQIKITCLTATFNGTYGFDVFTVENGGSTSIIDDSQAAFWTPAATVTLSDELSTEAISTVTILHGLDITPTHAPMITMETSGFGTVWVSARNATTFTINVETGGTYEGSWAYT
jgi:hypothetical protein